MHKENIESRQETEAVLPGVRIEPLRQEDLDAAQAHLDNLTKPRGSLGRLEDLAKRLFAMKQGRLPLSVSPALMFTVAGDHGVAAQGVSPFPQAVTRQMVQNFLNRGAAVNVLCRTGGMAAADCGRRLRGAAVPRT